MCALQATFEEEYKKFVSSRGRDISLNVYNTSESSQSIAEQVENYSTPQIDLSNPFFTSATVISTVPTHELYGNINSSNRVTSAIPVLNVNPFTSHPIIPTLPNFPANVSYKTTTTDTMDIYAEKPPLSANLQRDISCRAYTPLSPIGISLVRAPGYESPRELSAAPKGEFLSPNALPECCHGVIDRDEAERRLMVEASINYNVSSTCFFLIRDKPAQHGIHMHIYLCTFLLYFSQWRVNNLLKC